MVVALFVPCYVDELWPQAGRAAVELMEALGHDVVVREAVCCGQVLSNSGDAPQAARVRAAWSRAHGESEVVVLSASCCGHLRRTATGPRPRLREFCEWMVEHAPARFPVPVPRRVALHASCASLRETHSAWAVRDLLGRVPGLTVCDPAQAEECCGFGGSFATTFAALSVRMGTDKVAALRQAGGVVDAVVSADCSCMIHLQGLAPPDLPFHHVAEILREAIR